MTDDVLVARLPTIDEFLDLRRLSGLTPKSREAAERGVPNSLHAVVIERDGRAIAMGRIVGDGGTAYQVVDMAVLPEFQRQGLGLRVLTALMAWFHETAAPTSPVNSTRPSGSRMMP